MWPGSVVSYDITLSTVEENLALDEGLLDCVEVDPTAACLRFWQFDKHIVVLGRSNHVETEVNINACAADGIPIFRRATGGGTVLIGPGCLCYSLALPLTHDHRSVGVSHATAKLMSRTAGGLREILPNVEVCGTSDLVLDGLKFSGNAQRWLRRAFIHHGTLLFDFDLSLLEKYLNHPTREPSYRNSRGHSEFVTNVNLTPDELKQGLSSAWNSRPATCSEMLLSEARKIAAARYGSSDWKISR